MKKAKISIILTSIFGVGLLLSSVLAPAIVYAIAKPTYFDQNWIPNPDYKRIDVLAANRNIQNMNKIVNELTYEQIKNDIMFSSFIWAKRFVNIQSDPYTSWKIKLANLKWVNHRISYELVVTFPYYNNWETDFPNSKQWLHHKFVINVNNAELFFNPASIAANNVSLIPTNSIYQLVNGSIDMKVYQTDMKLLNKSWQTIQQNNIGNYFVTNFYSYTIDSKL